jgi:hypothetical protein
MLLNKVAGARRLRVHPVLDAVLHVSDLAVELLVELSLA